MLRSFVASVVVLLAAAPAISLACDEHAEKPAAAKTDTVKTAPAAAKDTAKTATPAQTPAPKTDKQPATTEAAKELQSALLGEIDVLVADKCSCSNAADCTCKKGQCKCKACKKSRMVEPVKGTQDALKLPKEARFEATSGVFI